MKVFAGSILILLITAQTFCKWAVLLSFQMNRDYIAANLCENRTKPRLHCNGRCVLIKKIKGQEKQETPSGIIKWGETLPLFVNKLPDFTCMSLDNPDKFFAPESSLYKTGFVYGIFHPPLY
jgi:hypothetical protein